MVFWVTIKGIVWFWLASESYWHECHAELCDLLKVFREESLTEETLAIVLDSIGNFGLSEIGRWNDQRLKVIVVNISMMIRLRNLDPDGFSACGSGVLSESGNVVMAKMGFENACCL